jgi:hypothetical protein
MHSNLVTYRRWYLPNHPDNMPSPSSRNTIASALSSLQSVLDNLPKNDEHSDMILATAMATSNETAGQLTCPSPIFQPKQHKADSRIRLFPGFTLEVMKTYQGYSAPLNVGLQSMLSDVTKYSLDGTAITEWRTIGPEGLSRGAVDAALGDFVTQAKGLMDIAVAYRQRTLKSLLDCCTHLEQAIFEFNQTPSDSSTRGDAAQRVADLLMKRQVAEVSFGRLSDFVEQRILGAGMELQTAGNSGSTGSEMIQGVLPLTEQLKSP